MKNSYRLMVTILFTIILFGCSAAVVRNPTPFTTTNKVIKLMGCEELKLEIEKKNKTLPAGKKLEADC